MATTQVKGAQVLDGTITDADVAAANKDGAAGTASMRTLGTAATQASAGNDSRLSDSRTPTAHALDSATFHTVTDITTLNATTSAHGLLPKLDGATTTFLRGDGTFVAPASYDSTPDRMFTWMGL